MFGCYSFICLLLFGLMVYGLCLPFVWVVRLRFYVGMLGFDYGWISCGFWLLLVMWLVCGATYCYW